MLKSRFAIDSVDASCLDSKVSAMPVAGPAACRPSVATCSKMGTLGRRFNLAKSMKLSTLASWHAHVNGSMPAGLRPHNSCCDHRHARRVRSSFGASAASPAQPLGLSHSSSPASLVQPSSTTPGPDRGSTKFCASSTSSSSSSSHSGPSESLEP